VQFGKLIEAERAKRTQSIDADTAAEQARVEVLEKEYEAKLKREREGETQPAAPSSPNAPLATPPQPEAYPSAISGASSCFMPTV